MFLKVCGATNIMPAFHDISHMGHTLFNNRDGIRPKNKSMWQCLVLVFARKGQYFNNNICCFNRVTRLLLIPSLQVFTNFTHYRV